MTSDDDDDGESFFTYGEPLDDDEGEYYAHNESILFESNVAHCKFFAASSIILYVHQLHEIYDVDYSSVTQQLCTCLVAV